ncbi:MAG: ATP-binding protein [Planctomycetota bacterium]|nr:ATP-binding protein [Planctomycetota bacterium]
MPQVIDKVRRIIVIDDNEGIHEDFRKILSSNAESEQINADEAFLFGEVEKAESQENQTYELDSAMQGQDGLELVRQAVAEGRPYGVAFVDMRMPPGWDGVKTIEHLWQVDPELQVVICTAYSDYSWKETIDRLGLSDQLLILKKPFDVAEVAQLAAALTRKREMQRQLKGRVDLLEEAVKARTESLNDAVASLNASNQFVQSALDSLSEYIAVLDFEGHIEHVNERWLSAGTANPITGGLLTVGANYLSACHQAASVLPFAKKLEIAIRNVLDGNEDSFSGDYECISSESDRTSFAVHVTHFEIAGSIRAVVAHEDTTNVRNLQDQLANARQLESVGRLAAGVAHEINTPIQYIGDNTRFLRDSFADLEGLLGSVGELLGECERGEPSQGSVNSLAEAARAADLKWLQEEVPRSIEQSLDGIDRVATIIRAMKEFSHPGQVGRSEVDINRAIESTVTVARSEWKDTAIVETDFDPNLPALLCVGGEINQVLLNLLINAIHAIGDNATDDCEEPGTIRFSTRLVDDAIEIRVADSGSGISVDIQSRIFDPFFTTKEVGRGTGQGLSLARSIIVDHHDGSLSFETAPDRGTTFIIQLPLNNRAEKGSHHDFSHSNC